MKFVLFKWCEHEQDSLKEMSRPLFFNYDGVGKTNNELYSYSQAVKLGPFIKCSGQGGWDSEGNIPSDFDEQLQLAFENVDVNIRTTGGAGWKDVVCVRSFHMDLDNQFELFVRAFRKWMPDHQPTWTCVGVTKLGIPGMLFEIEVEAYAP